MGEVVSAVEAAVVVDVAKAQGVVAYVKANWKQLVGSAVAGVVVKWFL